MLNQLFEWYRIAEVTPTDDTLEKRRAALADIVKAISDGDAELLAAAVCIAIAGVEQGFDDLSPFVKTVTDAIKAHQPAFPGRLHENGLHVRACVCIALGEILDSSLKSGLQEYAQLISALIISALGSRPPATERYLREVLSELNRLAYEVAEQAATRQRELGKPTPLTFPKLELADEQPPAMVKFCRDLYEATKKALLASRSNTDAVHKRLEVLSEELNLLWWLYSGYISATGESVESLVPGRAALRIGHELAGLAIVPPFASTRELVRRAVSENRKAAQLGEKELSEIVKTWTPQDSAVVCNADISCKSIVGSYPAMLPASWICARVQESGANTGWQDEFGRKAGMSADVKHTIPHWAIQVFNERVAKRLLVAFIGA